LRKVNNNERRLTPKFPNATTTLSSPPKHPPHKASTPVPPSSSSLEESSYIQTDISFELVCLDSVLQAACEVVDKEFRTLSSKVLATTDTLKRSAKLSAGKVENAQELLRQCKNEISILEGRTEGMDRAMEEVLGEDEDLALMNLTKLITEPGKFIQPVSKTVLEEEGDEPELIIEAYSQQSLSTLNGLKLLRGQVQSTEELVSMQLDRNRNRLLAYNTLLSLVTACLAAAGLVGSFFGMNINNGIEQEEGAFPKVVWGTMGGTTAVGVIMVWKLTKTGVF
jgi:magnesium transporter